MTDKEWNDIIAEIHNLRFQLMHNMIPETQRDATRARLKVLLEKLMQEYE